MNFHERRRLAAAGPGRSPSAESLPPERSLAGAGPAQSGSGSSWPWWTVIPAGTVLYRGTSLENVDPSQPWPFTWFTRDVDLALAFANQYEDYEWEESRPLFHIYVLERDLRLPLIASEGEMEEFGAEHGLDLSSPGTGSRDVREAGLPGWMALGQYRWTDGDDILIGDVDALRYECSFDGMGRKLGRLGSEAAPSPRGM